MSPMLESGLKLVFLWVVLYPIVGALVSFVFAGPVAAAEDTASFGDAFLFLLMLMTLTDIPLTAWAPTGTTGIVITLLMSIIQILVLCVFVGVSAGPCLDPFLDAFGLVPRASGTAVRSTSWFIRSDILWHACSLASCLAVFWPPPRAGRMKMALSWRSAR